MATEVILPRVDMDMETGKFASWLVKEGETVRKGQPLFEIETDKAAMEVESPAAGILKGIAAEPGDVLPVGAIVGWIASVEEEVPSARPVDTPPAEAEEPSASAETPQSPIRFPEELPQERAGSDGAIRATPMARRLAREAGADIASLKGSGPGGRIQARDVSDRPPGSAALGSLRGLHRDWLVK